MKSVVFALAVLFAASFSAVAQDAKPYREGPVTDVSFIKIKPGHFDDYMKWLQGPWKRTMEAAKAKGLVSGYAVYVTEARHPGEADMILAVTYPNMAALDRSDDFDKVAATTMGDDAAQNKAAINREDLREVLGGQLMREMVLK